MVDYFKKAFTFETGILSRPDSGSSDEEEPGHLPA